MRVGIAGVGVVAPGLVGWEQARAILRDEAEYREAPIGELATIPAAIRRRTSIATRIAIAAALEAVAQSGIPAKETAAVFGSGTGSASEVNHMLDALAKPDMAVSPTHFHNSVHNAAVGYWCMIAGSHLPSTSVTCHDDTFAAALLKAVAQVVEENQAVVLSVFDAPFPPPLHASRQIAAPAAVAIVLTPRANATMAEMEVGLAWDGTPPAPALSGAPLSLYHGNPAARGLAVLGAIARRESAVSLPYLDTGRVSIALWHR